MAHIQAKNRTSGPRKGQKYYIVRWVDIHGEEKSKSFDKKGSESYPAPGTAHAFKKEVENRLITGSYTDPKLGEQPFGDLFLKWANRAKAPRTKEARMSTFGNLGVLKSKPVGKMHQEHLREWLDVLREGRPWADGKPLAATTIGLAFQHVKTVLNQAVNDDILTKTPARGVEAPSKVSVENIVTPVNLLTLAQAEALLGVSRPKLRTMMLVAMQAGLRPSEIVGLRYRDIDLGARTLRVEQQIGRDRLPTFTLKTETSRRTVPLPDELYAALSAYLKSCDMSSTALIFPSRNGRPMKASEVWEQFKNAAKRAGLPDRLTWKDCRHFYASKLIQYGASVKAVQLRLGHASPDITLKVYTHLWPGEFERTIEAVNAAWEGVTVPKINANNRDSARAAKTHCINGHPFDDANSYVDPVGRRHCRACKRDRKRRDRAESAAA
ncbi:tyrosine-type recombinase/integrase [Nocardia sp. CA-128927]|uniref:tyrosine-type recombinase/integrase n=1 Tax=Nocardia sp. CA-128927 TaxID=3239975 RepID=UPI003D95BBB6